MRNFSNMQKITNKKIALIITTFENNIGLKLAALKTYIKHKPDIVDVFFLYGGKVNKKIKNEDKNSNLEWYDIYIDVPDNATCTLILLLIAVKPVASISFLWSLLASNHLLLKEPPWSVKAT